MDFSGIGGIAIAIIAALWLMVFVPSKVRGESAEEQLEAVLANDVNTRQPSNNFDQKQRLTATSRISWVLALIGLIGSVALGVLGQSFAAVLYGLLATVPITVAGLALAVAASKAAGRIQVKVARVPRVRDDLYVEPTKTVTVESIMRDRGWTPVELPKPLANRPGTLRQVAPVASFEGAKATAADVAPVTSPIENSAEKADLDVLEILRRRRAI
jgi:hypothetical protein